MHTRGADAWYMLYNKCQLFLRYIEVMGLQKISLWYNLKEAIIEKYHTYE